MVTLDSGRGVILRWPPKLELVSPHSQQLNLLDQNPYGIPEFYNNVKTIVFPEA
jgi:hypothetical protein